MLYKNHFHHRANDKIFYFPIFFIFSIINLKFSFPQLKRKSRRIRIFRNNTISSIIKKKEMTVKVHFEAVRANISKKYFAFYFIFTISPNIAVKQNVNSQTVRITERESK